jgi:hypothetical protein
MGQIPPAGVPGQGPAIPPPGAMVQIPQEVIEANLLKAIQTAKSVKNYLKPGKIWVMRGPAGDIDIKGALMYQNIIIGTVHFSPENGSILIQGYKTSYLNYSNNFSVELIREKFNSIIGKLVILDCAEFNEPEQCFAIPIVMDGKIISYLKVYIDGIHVMQDSGATQEMYMYGQTY